MELTEKEQALIKKKRKKEEKRNRTTEPVKMFIITAILSPIVWYTLMFIHIFIRVWNIMAVCGSWQDETGSGEIVCETGLRFWYSLWQAFLGNYTYMMPTPIILLVWTLVMFTGPMLVLSYLRYRSITKRLEKGGIKYEYSKNRKTTNYRKYLKW